MKKKIGIRNATNRRLNITHRKLRVIINKILKALNIPAGFSLDILFLSDKAIKGINKKYLKTSSPTDVLVFDYANLTADLAISLDTAQRNARIYKTSYKDEIILYLIHGILHLAGYDDVDPDKKKKMLKKQDEIFKNLVNFV
jgi:probable rRNA maturation factor